MKYSFVIAALLGNTMAAHHHHHHHHNYVQMQADPAPEAAIEAAVAAEPEEEKKGLDKDKPTAEDVKAANKAVLEPKPMKTGSEFDRTMGEAQADDAQDALDVAKHDAIGKGIIADMYKSRAQKKLDDAEKARIAESRMVELLEARVKVNEAQEKARQASAFKAHKAHVLHVKEHYANLEARAAAELAADHSAWKSRYGAQKRLPLDTAADTWTANMPEHVIDSSDFWIKAPAPVEKLMADAKKGEDAAEEAAKPAPPKKLEVPKVPTPAEAEQDQLAAKGLAPPASVTKAEAAPEAAPAAPEAAPAFIQMGHLQRHQESGDDDESGSESSGDSSETESTDNDSD